MQTPVRQKLHRGFDYEDMPVIKNADVKVSGLRIFLAIF